MAWTQAEVSELYLRASKARALADDVRASARRIRTHRPLLDRCYPSVPDSVRLARAEFAAHAAWCGASDEQVQAIRRAVSEAVTNSVVHAYPERRRSDLSQRDAERR